MSLFHEDIINHNPEIKKETINLAEYLSSKKRYFYEKKSSIKKLKENGFILFPERENFINNRIEDVCKERKITQADLAKMSGISRQTMNAVVLGKAIPGIDVALKCAAVLGLSVSDLFMLDDSAWIDPVTIGDNISLYFDVIKNIIIDSSFVKSEIKNGREYYDVLKKRYLSKAEYLNMLKTIPIEDIQFSEYDPFSSQPRIKSQTIKETKIKTSERLIKVHRRIGKVSI